MPAAKGREIQRSLFLPVIFKKHFPNWNRCDTVELCITILKIATLLFMIMLPGKPPYAQQGGEDPAWRLTVMKNTTCIWCAAIRIVESAEIKLLIRHFVSRAEKNMN